ERASANFFMDLGPQPAPALDRTFEAVLFNAVNGAIERDPGHDLGKGEMARLAAHLPDLLVGFAPRLFQMLHQRDLQRPARRRRVEAVLARLIERIHQLAVNVELELTVSIVTDAYRARPFVPRQPRQLPFGEPALAANAVHDLNLLRAAGRRAQQPLAPRLRLVVITGVHQREQRARRIA